MSASARPPSHPYLALVAGAAALTLVPVLFSPTASADWGVGVCVRDTAELEVPLGGFPPGNTFVGVYVGPGSPGVYTNRGAFTNACRGSLVDLAP